MATFPIQHLPINAVELKPIKSGIYDIYDLGQILSAYALDLPITIYREDFGSISGRIMGIFREGSDITISELFQPWGGPSKSV